MSAGPYNAKQVEEDVLHFWLHHNIYDKAKTKCKGAKRFTYLDGPPYTTGAIHIGHAWGKALRDSVLRYKRMAGFDVWAQPGFDMHGLPIEVSVEKKLGITNKREITERFGLKRFIEECQKYSLEQLWPMVKDFKRLGVWMDWDSPYMTIANEYIEGAWWALSTAHKNGFLYKGKKSMTWCPRCATALAKHELEYENVKEDSIFVKLPVVGRKEEYLIVWTTTPWTIPFNLAVMAHPEFKYMRAKIKETGEVWILAEALGAVITAVAGKTYDVLETFAGEKLKGLKYAHPFAEELPFQRDIEADARNAHTVVLSSKYVSLDAGSGLVHCAPGCGPEDYEVGREHGIPAYNELDEHGRFPETTGNLKGLRAKADDARFIELLQRKGFLVEKTPVEHEYAHCWRCHTPVVFRATDQWFLSTEKLRGEMRAKNKEVYWVPDWAGHRWFDDWLGNLQDWCISRQRFWGIPLPIWECGCGNTEVLAGRAEIKQRTGRVLDNLHRPDVDDVVIKCGCGKEMRRVPDVLDVWLDSGCAPWSPLGYPADKSKFNSLGFPELILEGKDQIRGWFNSLMCMSMISFGQVPYKAVYMHGFINDAEGRKMSKHLKNVISPYEVIDASGADTLRFYTIGGALPGLDMSYSKEDAKQTTKDLIVLWNVHNFVLDLAGELKLNPAEIDWALMKNLLDVPERHILSRLQTAIKEVTHAFEHYHLNETPHIVKELFLDISRTYIQLVRDKASVGDFGERQVVLGTLYRVLLDTIKLLAPLVPFISEQMYQHLRVAFRLPVESVHLLDWPKADDSLVDAALERHMLLVQDVMTAVLSARERAKLNVRWPLKGIEIVTHNHDVAAAVEALKDVIEKQVNVREVHAHSHWSLLKVTVKPNPGPLGKQFGKLAPAVTAAILRSADIADRVESKGQAELNVDGKMVMINKEHIVITRDAPPHFVAAPFRHGTVYIDTTRTPELESEGFAREVMRRVQDLRKKAGLNKSDRVKLFIKSGKDVLGMLASHEQKIREKVGALTMALSSDDPDVSYQYSDEGKVKDADVLVCFDVVKK